MGKIGFIKDNEENNKKGLKDKLHQKPSVKVIWEATPNIPVSIEEKEIEEDIKIEDTKEETEQLSNYFNLAIFYDFVNYKGVTIYNAMKFATDKEFCDKYYANKNKFLYTEERRKKIRQIEKDRLLYLQDYVDTIALRTNVRINKTGINNIVDIENLMSGEVLTRRNIENKDIKYIRNNVKKLESILKEIIELDRNDGFKTTKKCINKLINKYEDFLTKNC